MQKVAVLGIDLYVKRNKNDAADAEAICEAVTPPDDALRAGQERRTAGRGSCCTG